MIAADVPGSPDYALELLEYLTVHHSDAPKENLANSIAKSLSLVPELVDKD